MSARRPGWRGRQRRGGEPQREVRAPQIIGRRLPDLTLPYAPKGEIRLGDLARRFSLVICLFPAIGTDRANSDDQGRAVAWSQHGPVVMKLGYRLIAISSDNPAHQHDWLETEAPDYFVLCDQQLLLARELGLPTVRRDRRRVYEPTTLLIQNASVRQVFCPVWADDALNTIQYLKGQL